MSKPRLVCTFSLEEGKSIIFKGTELIILTLKGNPDVCSSTFVSREAYSDKSKSFHVFKTFQERRGGNLKFLPGKERRVL